MKVFVFVVNFETDDHLLRFLHSVADARGECPSVEALVHVQDNSRKPPEELEAFRGRLRVPDIQVTLHSSGENEGYFGVLPRAQSLVPGDADFAVYCNPDLLLDADFFRNLERLRGRADGVIAPAVLSLEGGVDLNPNFVRRPGRGGLRFRRWVYSHRSAYAAFDALVRVRECLGGWQRRLRRGEVPASRIYAAHGSMLLFADVGFFRRLPAYPCFLYGEELFVAEEARIAGVPVVYEPSLRVRNVRHAALGKLHTDDKRRLAKESVTFILERYYEERRAESP